MNRRELLRNSAALGAAGIPLAGIGALALRADTGRTANATSAAPAGVLSPLTPPPAGSIPVGMLISNGAVVIDFAGPWEVFESVSVRGRDAPPFALYTVAESREPVRASGGLRIVPNHTFAAAPLPKVLVIPAQDEPSDALLEWVRHVSRTSDVTMSVCTGAYVLARTGLLDGKSATTHHNAYTDLAMQFPAVHVKRGARFVEAGNLASSGGLSSGIDLALRVVARYFGPEVATGTAAYMEYQGQGWLDPDSNQAYRQRLVSTDAHPLCAVCEMEVDPASAPRSEYRGRTYYFCMPRHKEVFDAAPARFVADLPI